jgi:protease I
MAKIALVIAQEGFRDEEYFDTKKAVETKGVSVLTVSREAGNASGKLGGTATADVSIKNADLSGFDGVFFIGGPGASEYFHDDMAHALLRSAFGAGKLIGAICAGPATLAYAGLLKGKKATSFSGVADILKSFGAVFTGKDVEIDGDLITADGPASAEKFGLAIADVLHSKG